MLEFIHNIGSKVLNFFSTKFGSEGTKRQRDGLPDEFSSDCSPTKRFRLDMEPDLNAGPRFPAGRSSFNDRYYYRAEKTSNSQRTTAQLPLIIGRTSADLDSVVIHRPRDSQWSSATPMTLNSRNLNSKYNCQPSTSMAVSGDSGMSGFNFSHARQQVQDSGSFQFTANPEVVRFQGSSSSYDLVSDRAPPSVWSTTNSQSATGIRIGTPRLNGAAGESKQRSIFSRILGGGDAFRGIKCIDTRRRNKMAVKQCIRLNEKSMYQDLLNRQLTHHAPTHTLPSYSVERHNRLPVQQKAEEASSSAWGITPLFDRSGPFSSTRLNETATSDSIKSRLDASTLLLTSAVAAGRGGMSAVPLPAWRQTMAERRKQSQPGEFPERTIQTLQQQQQQRHLPMRAPPRNEFSKQTSVPNNRAIADRSISSSFSRKSSGQSDERRSSSASPIMIGSMENGAGRRSPEVEVAAKSPGVSNTSRKQSLSETRSPMMEMFERSLKDSRYAKKEFIHQVNSKTKSEFAKQDLLEKETTVKYFRDRREKNESQLISQVQNLLRISARLPVPLEETFVEEPEEEEEDVCELLDEEEVDETSTEFPELTDDQDALVSRALVPRPPDQILVEGFRLQITRKDLATLSGLNWLNDEVINFYLNLVMERSEKQGSRKVYAFSTFFYPKVKSEGHKGVRRWTKSIDLFTYDYILVPVHLGVHWCLAVVDFRKKQIRYYDSMGGNNDECLRTLRNYVSEECQVKRQTTFDWSGWQSFPVKDIPQQMNGSDCGMFSCKFAEYISRDAAITFEQRHMPYFRRRMVYEILTKTLM